MLVNATALAENFLKLKRLPDRFDPRLESEHVMALLGGSLSDFLADYEDFRPEGAGGSGLVFSAVYKPFNVRRAIKLPRQSSAAASTAPHPESTPFVDPELHALSKLSHQNITRLHSSSPLPHGGWCMITEYVEGPTPDEPPPPLDEFAHSLCCSDSCRSSELYRSAALRRLAEVIFQIVDALQYMHDTAHLLHFDLKPDNILVSRSGRPFVTDLGFARDVSRYLPTDRVSIGFTWKYAHPDLTDPHSGARVSRSPAKARNEILGSELKPKIDLFAFGRTIQETLHRLHAEYGDNISSDYVFNYLHLIACLSLDGHNAQDNSSRRRTSFVSDTALGMPTELYRGHAFATFAHIRVALERLLGYRRLEHDLPETDSWSSSTLNVSDLGITTLTPRVNSILQHPTFQRLSDESQLGMLDTVFPTATHSRLQHSLGVFHAVTRYLTALYYDPDSPVFRALFSPEDCKALLASSLLHDLGQTTFGHELEEIDRKEFSHESIGSTVLNHDVATDLSGRTLLQVVSGDGPDEWGLGHPTGTTLWNRQIRRPVDGVYQDILNGQLDADKLDYLIRDSLECRIAYGHGMDPERFLRSLTTTATSSGHLRLAIKQKGAASAEAFFFARYQLYQSLYWHHTFRAIKSMFLTAAYAAFDNIRRKCQPEMFMAFRSGYLKYVLGIQEPEPSSRTATAAQGKRSSRQLQDTIPAMMDKLMASSEGPAASGKYGHDRTLAFLWKLAGGQSRALLDDVISRNYYKRVLEVPLSSLREDSWLALRERFTGDNRVELQDQVNGNLSELLRKAIQDQSQNRQSLVTDRALERFQDLAGRKYAFTIDLPLRGWYASGGGPLFVSDYKRRHFRTEAGAGAVAGTLWSDHLGDLMRRIAFVRVFCEPDAHKLLTRVLNTKHIGDSVKDVLPQLASGE